VFVGLADELAADGFTARAVAALKRVEKLEPGRSDVEARLAALARVGRAQSILPAATPLPTAARPKVEIGLEVMGPATLARIESEKLQRALRLAEEEAARRNEAAPPGTAPPETSTPGSPAEAPPPATLHPSGGVADRLRGVFRRFLATLPPAHEPDSSPGGPAPQEAEAVGDTVEEDLPTLELEETSAEGPLPAEDGAALPTLELTEEAGDEEAAAALPPPPSATASAPPRSRAEELNAFLGMSEDRFQHEVADLIEEMLVPADEAAASLEEPAPARPLLTGPLFEGLSDDERVALVRGLKLRTFEPGDVILTEGEAGGSLFLLTAGAVKVFVRNPAGHNLPLDSLGEGDFFGEISTLSGRPRTATVTAAALCELLELDRASLGEIALRYPHVSERLRALSRERAEDPEAAALRARESGPSDPSLESHFDDERWEPRLRLRLADAFLRTGQVREAGQVLIDLADDLVRHGQNERAVALLKKVEQLQGRPRGSVPRPAAPPAARKGPRAASGDRMREWLIDVVRDTVRRRAAVATRGHDPHAGQAIDPETMRAYGRGLVASPLFEGLSEDELLALVRGLELRMFEPGDIVLTEGEPGQSVFIVAAGSVRVFIRNRAGQDVALRPLEEGAFFGEISAISGRARTATVTAAAPSALLELDRPALEAITRSHPRVREILEDVYIERAGDPVADAIRRQASAGGPIQGD